MVFAIFWRIKDQPYLGPKAGLGAPPPGQRGFPQAITQSPFPDIGPHRTAALPRLIDAELEINSSPNVLAIFVGTAARNLFDIACSDQLPEVLAGS